ncbi:MAG: hypothetical protein ACO3A2_06745 [Bdellovibrionia bacterium]
MLLDRDGVLNSRVIDAEHGTMDRPLHSSRMEVYPWVPRALLQLQAQGYGLAIATNPPAAANGKTTHERFVQTHERVLNMAQNEGAQILSSHLCFHRSKGYRASV